MKSLDYALDVLTWEKNKLEQKYSKILTLIDATRNEDKIYDIEKAIKILGKSRGE